MRVNLIRHTKAESDYFCLTEIFKRLKQVFDTKFHLEFMFLCCEFTKVIL